MKKKIIFIALFLLLCFVGSLSYRKFIIKRTDGYVMFVEDVMRRQHILKFHKRVSPPGTLEDIMKGQPYWIVSQEGIQVEEIVKRTSSELVMIVKWGSNNEKAYVSIKNWLTRKHDRIVIYPLDLTRRIAIYE